MNGAIAHFPSYALGGKGVSTIIAVVIMGIYIKINQDNRFDELKSILDDKNTRDKKDISTNDDCTHEES